VKKTHLTVLAIVAVAVVLAVGAAAAFADITSDTQNPITTANAAASYWDAASFKLTATDNEGIAYIYHALDSHITRLEVISGKPATADVTFPTTKDGVVEVGKHTLKYWAQDVNGNVEAQNTLTFEVVADTKPPTASAVAVSVRRGRTATLKYKVADEQPTKGTADVVIKIKNRSGKVVKTITAAAQNVNADLKAKFRCTLRRGVYKYHVSATDASGNAASKVGVARLTVK
jgi:hypothetical protein